ncbi:MAG TPA: SCO family protein [Acidobacteriota bacterium]|nr:SCO family protein [Acidobacteriota bacterium]
MKLPTLPLFLLTLSLAAPPLRGQSHSHHAGDSGTDPQCHDASAHQAMGETEQDSQPVFRDVELLDQRGRRIHFFTDLVKGRTVVVQSMFTTCTTICPPMGANFAKLQKKLGRGSDVHLISVSIDPGVDTPQRLKAWQARFGGNDANWTLVTGSKRKVDSLLKSLGLFSPDKVDHSPTVLLGSEPANHWTRTNGLANPDKLLQILDEIREPSHTR